MCCCARENTFGRCVMSEHGEHEDEDDPATAPALDNVGDDEEMSAKEAIDCLKQVGACEGGVAVTTASGVGLSVCCW